jgi:dimethylhistidine N-methyltransferase
VNRHDPHNKIHPADELFLNDVISGLGQPDKQLQCKYFYDQRGSKLFDQICELDEYYLTRTEQQIISLHALEMAEQLGREVMLIEFGSGSSHKTRTLLDALAAPVAYVPIDISEDHLVRTAAELRIRYPHIEILPLVSDFTKPFQLPRATRPFSHAAVFFPGSTIGNFRPDAAVCLMKQIANILGPQGGMLIGIDLQKEIATIEAAYNDAQGVTDQFNLNVLHRVNRELGANFNVDQFSHKAVYNDVEHRVEIFVVSQCEQRVTIGDHEFLFRPQEHVLTEYSHKYTIAGFVDLASQANFALHKHWTDEREFFAVLHLVNENTSVPGAEIASNWLTPS